MKHPTKNEFDKKRRMHTLKLCRTAAAKKRYHLLLISILIGSAFCFHTENVFADGDVWYTVFSRPFYSDYLDNRILAIAEFGGTVYIGVGRDSAYGIPSANVYRLVSEGCKIWDCVTPPWSSDTGGYGMSMSVFKGSLYVGTDQGEVWRTADGLKWENVTGNWVETSICAMAVFDGYIYIVADGIRRSSDGSSWGEPAVLDDDRLMDCSSMEVFDNYLYAGWGLIFLEDDTWLRGIALWRTEMDNEWSMFKEEVQEPGPILEPIPEHVHALEVFKGHLYIGEYHGSGLFRTDGVTSWEYHDSIVLEGEGVFRLEEHDETLYLGMNNWASIPSGDYLLYSSTNGIDWSTGTGYPVHDSDTEAVGSLLSYGDKLYVGLYGEGGVDGTLEILALGPSPAPTCAIKGIEECVWSAVTKIHKNIDVVNEYAPNLPPIEDLIPIGPLPPPGDELFDLEFILVTDMINAVSGIGVSPEVEWIRELVLQDLETVNAEVVLAMSMLYEATSEYNGEELQILDEPDVLDEVLEHLNNALESCHGVSLLLPLMQGEKPPSSVGGIMESTSNIAILSILVLSCLVASLILVTASIKSGQVRNR